MVWYGMAWHGMAWHGMAWYMVWYGMVWYGMDDYRYPQFIWKGRNRAQLLLLRLRTKTRFYKRLFLLVISSKKFKTCINRGFCTGEDKKR